jgi:hypothetical protein
MDVVITVIVTGGKPPVEKEARMIAPEPVTSWVYLDAAVKIAHDVCTAAVVQYEEQKEKTNASHDG